MKFEDRHVIAFSGGKDSTALVLWAIENLKSFESVFCDTGWEHPMTYKYIEEMNQKLLGGKLIVLKPEKYSGMVDLVTKKGRVPSAKARFCTEELKVKPMIKWLKENNDPCKPITLYQGIRAEESKSRSQLPQSQFSDDYGCQVERPLFHWTWKQVFELMKKHNVAPNPLYTLGAGRVGCFPCVMINHGELYRMTIKTPEIWDRIELLESSCGRSFFPPNYIPERFQTGFDEKSQHKFPWAKDVKVYIMRGKQADLWWIDTDSVCMSIYNLCER